MKKEREFAHLLHFKEIYPFFPDGEIECSESPDFLLQATEGSLGIEHTEIFHPGLPHGVSIQAQESLQKRTIQQAKELYSEDGEPNLKVLVLFNPGNILRKQDTSKIAQEIVNLAKSSIPAKGDSIELRPTFETWETFPKEVAFIKIRRSQKEESDAFWKCLGVVFIPSINENDIREKIIEKENKLYQYKEKCEKVWLLIVADEFRISSTINLTSQAIRYNYQTGFDRVFVFWVFSGKIVELKVVWFPVGLQTVRPTPRKL